MKEKSYKIGGVKFKVYLIIMFLLCWPIVTEAGEWESPVKYIKVGGSSVGGTGYQLAMAFSEIWSKIPNLTASALPGSSGKNPVDLGRNRIQVGETNMKSQYQVYHGLGKYEKYEGIRYILPFAITSLVWFVRSDSDIYKLTDLEGKHISPGAEGTLLKEMGLASLAAVGITPESCRKAGGQISYGSIANSVTMLQDKIIVALCAVPPPDRLYTPIMPIESTMGVRLIPMDENVRNYIEKHVEGTSGLGIVKGGLYKNQPEDYRTVVSGYPFCCRSDLPDELVYRMVRLAWENGKKLVSMNPSCSVFTKIELALHSANIPLHPGAARYYIERGLKLTDQQLPPELK